MSDLSDPRAVIARTSLADAGTHQVLRWAVAHAALAPSELNTQPWSFVLRTEDGAGAVDVHLDPARCLAEIDPTRREAVLACGAAVLNLRLALLGAELEPEVALCPDPASRDLLATVLGRTATTETERSSRLRGAIPERSTSRRPFLQDVVAPDLVESLVEAAQGEGVLVRRVRPRQLAVVAEEARSSQEALWARAAVRQEAARWARGNGAREHDGIPGAAYGQGPLRAALGAALEAHGGPPPWAGGAQASAVLDAPVLLALGTDHDSRTEVLRAGAGMQRLLLTATAAGLAASYVNASLHVPRSRARLGDLLDLGCPQVLIRVGHGVRSALTPRRPMQALVRDVEDLRP